MISVPSHAFVVASVPWNVFSTLTFRVPSSESKALRELSRFTRWAAAVCSQKHEKFIYLGRLENGEEFGRLHLHILMVVPEQFMGYFVIPKGMVPKAHKAWGLGMTSWRRVHGMEDPALPYLVKELSGADYYEINKTAGAQHLVISRALFKVLKSRKRVTGSQDSISAVESTLKNTGETSLTPRDSIKDTEVHERL
jgi:hypothetical protein